MYPWIILILDPKYVHTPCSCLSQEGEELERLDIAKLSRVELNKLLVAKGIRTKAQHAGRDEF